MSSALVSLGIGTGFERYYGVLKRLGTTPLGRPRWILAKLLTVVAIEFLQWLLIIPAALALGWNPAWGWGTAILAALLATLAFGGIGLLLAGTLPGMLNLAVCNALYLVLMLIGGVIIRLSVMPAPLAAFARVLPTAPLTEIMQGAFRPADISLTSWLVLGTWALLAPVAAAVTFRWE
jgi:ABC-2 type transport system permease protein